MVDTTILALFVIACFDSIGIGISVYMFYRFMIKPQLKFRYTKRRGLYADIHSFDKRGQYKGSLENISIDDVADYVGRKIFGILPKPQTLDQKIKTRLKNKMDKEEDRMIDIILKDKKITETLQKRIFAKIKDEFETNESDIDGSRPKMERR